MTDQQTIYVLAALGLVLSLFSKLWKRTSGTSWQWVVDNKGYLLAAFVLTAATMLIGPGDNVDLGSYVARTWAFGIAVAINEAASAFASGPKATMTRKGMLK